MLGSMASAAWPNFPQSKTEKNKEAKVEEGKTLSLRAKIFP